MTIAARTWTVSGTARGQDLARPPRGCAGARSSRRPPGRRGRRRAARRRRARPARRPAAPARSRCGEVAVAAAAHGVHEVVGDVDALERRRERALRRGRRPGRPRRSPGSVGAARVARRGSARAWPRRSSSGSEAAADVAGGAGEEDAGSCSWLRVAAAPRDEPRRGGVVRTGHDGWMPMADGLSIKEVAEQTGLARRHDPHVGAALRLPRARGAPPRATGATEPEDVETLRRARAHRQRGLSVPRRARARAGDRRRRRTIRRSTPRWRRPTTAPGRRCCASRRWSRCRGRSSTSCSPAPPRRCSSAPSSASASTARSSRATGGWRATPTRRPCSPTSPTLRRPSGAPVEVPIAEGEALAQRVGGRSSTRPATRRACWPGSSPARSSPAARTTSIAASRRSGPSTRARRAAPRRSAARLAGNVDAAYGAPARGAAGRPPAGAWSSRRPRSRR